MYGVVGTIPSGMWNKSAGRLHAVFPHIAKDIRPFIVATALLANLAICRMALAQDRVPEKGPAFVSEKVLEQIAAIGREKKSWTPVQRKLNPKLLLEAKKRLRRPIADGVPDTRAVIEVDAAGRTLVDIRAIVSVNLLSRIKDLGGQVINSFARYNAIRALLPIESL
ncbi:MAG: hypothetical protein QGH15_06510 [Kiritimatiellia bacterium]|jgi:hypothetical protein|nr:hypothetical protein [Kiritimatiellia bacterium]